MSKKIYKLLIEPTGIEIPLFLSIQFRLLLLIEPTGIEIGYGQRI